MIAAAYVVDFGHALGVVMLLTGLGAITWLGWTNHRATRPDARAREGSWDSIVELERRTFEEDYARGSRTTVERLHAAGRYGERCTNCDYELCTGWRMGHQYEDALFEDAMR